MLSAATHLSATEQRSVKAERYLIGIKRARFIYSHMGEDFDGVITSVTKFGVFVSLKNFDIEGLIRVEDLGDDYFEYIEERLELVGKRSQFVYHLGMPLRVTVSNVNIELGQIDFVLTAKIKLGNKKQVEKNMILQKEKHKTSALKSVKRLRKILSVLGSHGFQNLVEKTKLSNFSKQSTKDNVKHLSAAERLRLAFEELGPSFVKFGQVLASRPDLIPEDYVAEFKELQDNVKSLPFSKIEEVLKQEFGDYNKIFSEFDEEPLAAASIAQVHRAKLLDGSSVVVKIQRPGILKTIQEDLNILYNIASLLEAYAPESRVYNPTSLVDEFFKALELETNFIIEANNIQRFRENFSDDPNIYIPKVFLNHTSSKVLVMEEVIGKRLSQFKSLNQNNANPRQVVDAGLKAFLKMVFKDGFFHGDLHAGNIFVMPNNKIGLVDFGVVGRISKKTQESISIMLLALTKEDYEQLAYEFVDLAPYEGGILIDQFAHDLRNLFGPYHGLSFKNVNLGKILMDSTTVAAKHGLRIPQELMLFFKSIVTIEGMGRSLVEDFDILSYVNDFAPDLLKHRYENADIIKNLSILGRDSGDLIASLPRHMKQLLRKLNSPNYASKIQVEDLEELKKSLQNSANLLFLGLVISSLILASAIALHADKVYGVLDMPFYSLATFGSALVLAIAAFYHYIRKP